MEWQAILKGSGGVVSSSMLPLSELLVAQQGNVAQFYWLDSGTPKIGCSVPIDAQLVAFKRQYVDTGGKRNTVFVLGWTYARTGTYMFLQPGGLVEVSSDREFETRFEIGLRRPNAEG